MLKSLAQLTHTVEDKVCQFICEHDTPISTIKEALFQFQKYIGHVEDVARIQAEAHQKAPIVESVSEKIVPFSEDKAEEPIDVS